jgi:probable F420-dependent oxidoreductase
LDIGLGMNTHGLVYRDEHDASLHNLAATDMQLPRLAQLAERLGYHSLWFGDHFAMERPIDSSHPANVSGKRAYPDRPVMLDTAVSMTTAAASTSTIKVASSTIIAPYRHPLTVAHQFATIDAVSGGRVIMGVSAGWAPGEFAAVGASFEHRGAITDECLEIYKLAWTEPWPEYHGRFFEFGDISVEPKPAQKPHPPIVYGGMTEAGARRAARHCDGLYPILLDRSADPGRFDGLLDVVSGEAERVGRDLRGFQLLGFVSALVTDASHELAQADPRPTLCGTAEQVLEDMARFAEHGYSHLTIYPEVPSGTIAEMLELVERLGTEVIPEAAEIDARSVL